MSSTIRPFSAADLAGAMQLAQLVRQAPAWTTEDFRKLVSPHPEAAASGVLVPGALLLRRAWIAEAGMPAPGQAVLGLAVVQCLRVGGAHDPDGEVEAELESILVHPDHRRQAIGSGLLDAATGWCRQQHAQVLRLEVRSSNQPALSLYQRHGFHTTGHRPRYYRHPDEDAVLMELSLFEPRQL